MPATGAYIAQSDVEDVWGETNVAAWSQKDPASTTADEDRIEQAIKWGEQQIEDLFRGGEYLVPFAGNDSDGLRPLKDAMAAKAGWWLYRSRGLRSTDQTDRVLMVVQEADRAIQAYLAGPAKLNAVKARSDMPTAPQVVM